jgi:hypothetical protein
MIKAYGIALTGFFLFGLEPAFAELGPRERQCIVGEQRVNGVCRALSEGAGTRTGDQGSTGNRGDAGRSGAGR